jgi:hypothetical protein
MEKIIGGPGNKVFAACSFFTALLLTSDIILAQPELNSWKINTTGATGYAGIPSNVQQVQYSPSNVYVSCTGVPDYTIGPWPSNPNVAQNQNFVFKITRNPQPAGTATTAIGLGHTGVWSNGVSIFNADDGMTYNNQGVWHRNAFFWEGASFDNCLGHPAPNGEYHHHVSPKCLYNINDSLNHSPIIGYAFDGFPVYGAYGWSGTNGTGNIRRIRTSYRQRNISLRTTLPDGSTASSPGPAVNSTYPVGAYMQDHEYVSGLGDLDERNGRQCVTPEYPGGTYAYFVTLDGNLNPVYPYTMCGAYYGLVQSGNTGPGGGHNTITESVTTYTATGLSEHPHEIRFSLYPNPASDYAILQVDPGNINDLRLEVSDLTGKPVLTVELIQPGLSFPIDVSTIGRGIYFATLSSGSNKTLNKLVVTGD